VRYFVHLEAVVTCERFRVCFISRRYSRFSCTIIRNMFIHVVVVQVVESELPLFTCSSTMMRMCGCVAGKALQFDHAQGLTPQNN
jgi:hypothetical protein